MTRLRRHGERLDPIDRMLNHIASLHVASRAQIGKANVKSLLAQGYIEQTWVGNYKLTEAGERRRRTGGRDE